MNTNVSKQGNSNVSKYIYNASITPYRKTKNKTPHLLSISKDNDKVEQRNKTYAAIHCDINISYDRTITQTQVKNGKIKVKKNTADSEKTHRIFNEKADVGRKHSLDSVLL